METDLINFDLPKNQSSIIKVIGIGGGGSNAVNHMCRQGIIDVDFVVCNTDAQALSKSPVPVRIQLGESLTEGRGAGNKPEIGRQAAIENLNDIIKVLETNTRMVFITAGMGGGTGTGAAPVIAKTAKEMGILTVAIVTIPFRNEGQRRINQAMEGIAELEKHVDSLLVVNNEKIREIYGDLKISEAFARADNILSVAAKGIAEIITVPGYVNVDFADVETVMSDSGVAIMGSGTAQGEDRALTAVKSALNSPLLNDNDIEGASNILINITSGVHEITMDEIGQVTDYIQECAGDDADLIWGNGVDESLEDKIMVTVIATGFSTNSIPELYIKKKQLDKIPLTDSGTKNPETTKEEIFEVKDATESDIPQDDSTERQRTIEFDIQQEQQDDAKLMQSIKASMQSKKSAQRVKSIQETQEKLRELRLNFYEMDDSIEELENEPAYRRKNIQIEGEKPSSEKKVSKYSLSDDKDNQTKLSENNPYLHDNVD